MVRPSCPACQEPLAPDARYCVRYGEPALWEEICVGIADPYRAFVDHFINRNGVEQEQRVGGRTVIDEDGVRQEAAPTRVTLTPGIAAGLKDGRLVRASPGAEISGVPPCSAPPAPRQLERGPWHAVYGRSRGAGMSVLQDAAAPGRLLSLASLRQSRFRVRRPGVTADDELDARRSSR